MNEELIEKCTLTDEEIIRVTIHPSFDASKYSVDEHEREIADKATAKAIPLIRKQERERIIEYMTGHCIEHWVNSRPLRWKCEECWQALKQEGEG